MKNLIKSVIAVIAIIFSSSVQAQTKSSKLENTLLWEVSGNGLTKPSYLYGTVHMICSPDYFLSEKTKKAFDASNKLVLEINFADPAEMADMQKMAMGKEPLSKLLSPEHLSKLDEILKTTTGMTVQQVDSFSLMTVMSLISMKTFGCTDMKLYEMEFIEMAKKRNIQIGGLETVKSQLDILGNAYTNDEMIKMLSESNQNETSKLVTAYKSENIDDLYNNVTDKKFTSEKTKKMILDQRNLNWVKDMPQMMKTESVFFAVGAGHLGGEFGVINLLRKAGYIVKPVMN
ncbi:TraB/GumN family protein [Flavobacterium johnsoniae]|uniref:TraB/GumN family protein n=1 Tax=Flavobacterium johnsoniae TaxID=986 RepID=UPI0025AED25E|nr:TraB/GumN family protein [Flavobacterium johnsoniae]WJS95582.1 TraB/GumN family protein [Flavobacterium johnsoniae]